MSTLHQPTAALVIANHHRLAVARKREELAALPRLEAQAALADLVEGSTDRSLLSGRVRHYLRALPRRGDRYADRVLRALGVQNPERRLRDLSDRQRDQLCQILRFGLDYEG